jgi:hypothetical protein
VNYQSANIAMEKMMASTSGTNMENKRLAEFTAKSAYGLILFAVISALSGAATARDRGINQPGPVGGTAGVGAPGVGVVDPGINQPGAAGNVGRPGVGAPGVGVADPGINQPGAAGNVGAPGVGRDPGINQPGEAGNRRRVR